MTNKERDQIKKEMGDIVAKAPKEEIEALQDAIYTLHFHLYDDYIGARCTHFDMEKAYKVIKDFENKYKVEMMTDSERKIIESGDYRIKTVMVDT